MIASEILLILEYPSLSRNSSSLLEPSKSKVAIPKGPSPEIESNLVHRPLGPFLLCLKVAAMPLAARNL
jgi:hypothetical protein